MKSGFRKAGWVCSDFQRAGVRWEKPGTSAAGKASTRKRRLPNSTAKPLFAAKVNRQVSMRFPSFDPFRTASLDAIIFAEERFVKNLPPTWEGQKANGREFHG